MDLFGGDTPHYPDKQRTKSGGRKVNPMLVVYGIHETQKRCRGCRFLYARRFSGTYWKCEKWSKGTATASDDHRVNWPACKLYEKEIIPET
jgi:hypothetical protein